jgi:hypothetical protein
VLRNVIYLVFENKLHNTAGNILPMCDEYRATG